MTCLGEGLRSPSISNLNFSGLTLTSFVRFALNSCGAVYCNRSSLSDSLSLSLCLCLSVCLSVCLSLCVFFIFDSYHEGTVERHVQPAQSSMYLAEPAAPSGSSRLQSSIKFGKASVTVTVCRNITYKIILQ